MTMIISREDLIQLAEKILHKHDPAYTNCNLNEGMENEYAHEAMLVADKFTIEKLSLKDAFFTTFNETFSGFYSPDLLRAAYREINDMLC